MLAVSFLSNTDEFIKIFSDLKTHGPLHIILCNVLDMNEEEILHLQRTLYKIDPLLFFIFSIESSQKKNFKSEIFFKNSLFINRPISRNEAETLILILEKLHNNSFFGHFLSRFIHDLKTPITSIQGILELIRDFNTLSDEDKENINLAITSGNNLQKFVENMLHLTKIKFGLAAPQKETFNLKSFFTQILEDKNILNPNFKKVKIEIKIDDKLDEIFCDKKLFDLFLSNTLKESIKKTKQGNIQISLKKNPLDQIEIEFETQSSDVRDSSNFLNETKSSFELEIAKEFAFTHEGTFEKTFKTNEIINFKTKIPQNAEKDRP